MPSKIATSVPADNDISVKEYIKITKYKNPEIDIKKLWHLKTTSNASNNGSRSRKGTDERIKVPGSPIRYEIQKKIAL